VAARRAEQQQAQMQLGDMHEHLLQCLGGLDDQVCNLGSIAVRIGNRLQVAVSSSARSLRVAWCRAPRTSCFPALGGR
jgi:hypothetical protein